LLAMFQRQAPAAVTQMRAYIARQRERTAEALESARLFTAIPTIDFSHQIIASRPRELAVLRLGSCGWSDLGSPTRLHRVLQRHRAAIAHAPAAPPSMRGQLDLAERTLSSEEE